MFCSSIYESKYGGGECREERGYEVCVGCLDSVLNLIHDDKTDNDKIRGIMIR
jgi:hypothetical protein